MTLIIAYLIINHAGIELDLIDHAALVAVWITHLGFHNHVRGIKK